MKSKRPFFTALLFTLITMIIVSSSKWIEQNDWKLLGTCYNHFGEGYSTNALNCIFNRLLNPMQLLPLAVILIPIFYIGGIITSLFLTSSKSEEPDSLPEENKD